MRIREKRMKMFKDLGGEGTGGRSEDEEEQLESEMEADEKT